MPLVGGANDVIVINSLTGSDTIRTAAPTGSGFDHITNLRESGPKFFNWDTKTTSFSISGTPAEFDIFIAANSLAPVLALATARPERQRLAGTPYEGVLQKGLNLIAARAVTFRKEAWRQAVLRG